MVYHYLVNGGYDMPIDQFNDTSFKRLYKLINTYPEAEEFIKSANVDQEENDSRPDSAFAWPEERRFRIDSPAQAALSRLYMEKQAGVPDAVRKRCEAALEIYGIDLPLQEKIAAAPDPDEYLLPEMQRFRVVGKESTKLAADAILRNERRMDPVTKAKASINLVKKSMEYNTTLPPKIYKLAGATMSYVPQMAAWLEARAAVVEDPTIKKAYVKLAESARARQRARENYLSDRNDLTKLADAIHELDDAAGLSRHYGKRLPDPMQTVFNTEKIAEDLLTVGDKQIPMSTLLAVPSETYVDTFGEDIADDFIDGDTVDPEDLRAVWDAIPFDLKQALASQMGW
jgi:hypothetical protein